MKLDNITRDLPSEDQVFKPFEELTKAERSEICNGCGGKGSKIVPPHAAFFKACCDHHDYGYWKGGAESDRKRCDKMFYKEMKSDCKRGIYRKEQLKPCHQ